MCICVQNFLSIVNFTSVQFVTLRTKRTLGDSHHGEGGDLSIEENENERKLMMEKVRVRHCFPFGEESGARGSGDDDGG